MEKPIKYIARFKVETQTPLGIGTGRSGLLNERLIARDANDLPYIPGTALAGVIRHELERAGEDMNGIFGYQTPGEKAGQGSRIVLSPSLLVADDNQTVIEGLYEVDYSHAYYSNFRRKNLPQRDHVRISHRGTAEKTGKFEEELVYKGTRFVFELELEGTEEDAEMWERILSTLNHPAFRIGAGTRKGFGQLRVLSCHTKIFDLRQKKDLLAYLGKSSSLNSTIEGWLLREHTTHQEGNWVHYKLTLTPEDFFLFGAGLGDEEVNMKPKTEFIFNWESGKAEISEEYILIPATSIKGALSHRTAFHFNRLVNYNLSEASASVINLLPKIDVENIVNQYFEDLTSNQIPSDSKVDSWHQLEEKINAVNLSDVLEQSEWAYFKRQLPNPKKEAAETSPLLVGEKNKAIQQLFGFAKKETGEEKGARGKLIFSDIYLRKTDVEEKVFNHVMIDRYTGGAYDGALYQERSVKTNGFDLDIFVEQSAFENEKTKQAFEAALNDLCTGNLQLGGNSTKGHGAFSGTLEIIKL